MKLVEEKIVTNWTGICFY